MSGKQTTPGAYPDARWFKEKTDEYKQVWDETPWHVDGDRKLKPLMASVRKYTVHLNKLPENFLPSVFDQHLAVLSQGYEYRILDIRENLGDDRFLCADGQGQAFCVWSRAVTTAFREGHRAYMTAVIPLGEASNGAVPGITYGPVLPWKSLTAADFARIGSVLARDLIKFRGLPGVIRLDPVPFWAAWTLSGVPPVFHGAEPVGTGWCEGAFSGDPEPLLKGAWKRDVLGKRVRLRKPGSKPFFEQTVIFDTKTLRGIILARRASYLEKLKASLAQVFRPDAEESAFISPTVEIIFNEILKRGMESASWTKPFDDLDSRREEEESRKHPDREKRREHLNEVLQVLLPYVNSGREPDWEAFAAENSLDTEDLAFFREMFRKYRH